MIWFLLLPTIATLQDNVNFDKTLSHALARAASEQRQLMLYFTSRDCQECKPLDTYFDEKGVRDALSNRYVAAKVDVDAFDGQACSEIYGINDVPAIVIVKPDGQITVKKEGDVDKGDLESIIIHGYIPEMDKPATADVPETSPTNEASSEYALQVGFFSSRSNAEKLSAEISARGFDTRVNEELREDKTFYRVLVGNYSSIDYASTDLNSLKNSGFSVKVHKNTH